MIKDITGQKFGRLTVVKFHGVDKGGNALWVCVCECGNQSVVRGCSLRNGRIKSCGCTRCDRRMKKNPSYKHGLYKHRLYSVWSSMKERCYNPKGTEYSSYGGRGITVCPEWRNNFKAFYDWAVSNGYDETAPRGQCTIDRIDNNKGYSPNNCRWIPQKQQYKNTQATERKKKK